MIVLSGCGEVLCPVLSIPIHDTVRVPGAGYLTETCGEGGVAIVTRVDFDHRGVGVVVLF